MKKYSLLLLVIIPLFFYCTSISKSISKDKMDIYLCIGQSNMAGRGSIEIRDKDTLVNVYLFTGKENQPWEKAANPFNKYSTVRKKIELQKLSPSYSFAKAMSLATPHTKIGLVVNAKGGTSIEKWAPGTLLYKEAILQTKKALQNGGVLKGVIWHQGEANVSKYKKYLPKLTALITSIRQDFNLPNLPFVAGQLSEDKPKRKAFNTMLLQLPEKVKNTAVVRSNNTLTIDKTHFNSASQRLMGKRYANKMLKLLNR